MSDILQKDIRYLKGVGEKRAAQFYKLNVFTIEDLLYHFPTRYVDYSRPFQVAFAPYEEPSVVRATVLKKNLGVRVRGGKTLFKVICADDTARLTLTFFNAQYTVERLVVGKEYLFYGKLSGGMLSRELSSPIFIPADSPVTQQPVYPLTSGLYSSTVSKFIKTALDEICEIPDYMPMEILNKYSMVDLYTAIKDVHFAASDLALAAAKERLIFDEFFFLQLGLSLMAETQSTPTDIKLSTVNIDDFLQTLPYTLTNAQFNAIKSVLLDFKSRRSMNRLLQGDVGSGKTVVAVSAMYCMCKNGVQSCMMAPTEILALQHYHTVTKMLEGLGCRVELLTAGVKAKEKRDILQRLANGEIDILIGTHSVLNESVVFKNLGLCITDEQHRFGVRQRNLITQKGNNPHVLVMSATPIPRTLAMIIYGNMQVSVIDEMPVGRKAVKTFFIGTEKRSGMFGFIDKYIKMGHQTYIVLPSIEEGENNSDMQSVIKYCEEVVKPMLPHAKVGLLHGKLKSSEKNAVMTAFSKGEIDILCSTTVVEVGLDVPNAVLMIIENADRYGLSALHQLRGRVGRSDVQSYCFLVCDNQSKNVVERLQFLSQNQSGFAVSQYDLEHRGPGDFFGARQHGLPSLKLAQLSQDLSVLQHAQESGKYILSQSPNLALYPKIKERVDKLFSSPTL
ncbi:MAG: ATP-dependent DNA helicase RecG [Oscillospiraceae bacterium]